jgi:hypothetical protein
VSLEEEVKRLRAENVRMEKQLLRYDELLDYKADDENAKRKALYLLAAMLHTARKSIIDTFGLIDEVEEPPL